MNWKKTNRWITSTFGAARKPPESWFAESSSKRDLYDSATQTSTASCVPMLMRRRKKREKTRKRGRGPSHPVNSHSIFSNPTRPETESEHIEEAEVHRTTSPTNPNARATAHTPTRPLLQLLLDSELRGVSTLSLSLFGQHRPIK
jgi:hypothetical protein